MRRVAYVFDGSTRAEGETEDHLVAGNLWLAVRIVQVQTVAIVAQRVQVGSADNDVHVV